MKNVSKCVVIGLLVSAADLAYSQPSPRIQEFTPVTTQQADIILLADGSPEAAIELQWTARCSSDKKRTAIVALGWKTATQGDGDQRLDISKFRDGFDTEKYETSGLLPHDQTAAGVEGPEPGINYYWRVLTRSSQGWIPSSIGRFEVPICPWDEPDSATSGNPQGAKEPGSGTTSLGRQGGER